MMSSTGPPDEPRVDCIAAPQGSVAGRRRSAARVTLAALLLTLAPSCHLLQKNVEALAGPRGLQDVSAIGSAAGRGLVDGATDAERAARLEALADQVAASLLTEITARTRDDLGPELRAQVREVVRTALDAATEPQRVVDLQGLTRALGSALTRELGEGIARDVGPAVTDVLRRELGPTLGASLDPALHPELDAAVRHLTRAAASEIVATLDPSRRAIVDDLKDVLDHGEQAGSRIAIGFGVSLGFTVALLVGALVLLRQKMRGEREALGALDLVTSQIYDTRESRDVRLVAAKVRAAGEGTPQGELLSRRLAHHKIEDLEAEFPELRSGVLRSVHGDRSHA